MLLVKKTEANNTKSQRQNSRKQYNASRSLRFTHNALMYIWQNDIQSHEIKIHELLYVLL